MNFFLSLRVFYLDFSLFLDFEIFLYKSTDICGDLNPMENEEWGIGK